MASLEELRRKRAALNARTDDVFTRTDAVIAESLRVADVAANAPQIIKNLEQEFAARTKLQGKDIAFLFFAVALQCCRQYLLTDFKDRVGDQEAAENTIGKERFDPHDLNARKEAGLESRHHQWYNPSLDEIILHPVPFDTNVGGKKFDSPLKGYGQLGHRGGTLGHDPILGWIFGTANIATSTLTTYTFQSYHIKSGGRGDFMSNNASTLKVLDYTFRDKLLNQGMDGKIIVATSIVKEAVHLMSDVNSKNSLPFPVINTFDPKMASKLADFGVDMANILNVGKQAALAQAINLLIAMLHGLTYNETKDGDKKLFEVRTRRILMHSNTIASASNILLVAIGTAIGAATSNQALIKKSLQKLDIGGFIVTIHRLITDTRFIKEIKNEFVMNEFDKLIQGDM